MRNAVVSLPTFLIDLGLLFLLVRQAHLDYRPATIVSFLIANGVSYVLARHLVFAESKRGYRSGLVYFLAIAALSTLLLTPLMWVCVALFRLEFIVARIVSAGIVGVGGYVLNLLLNFRVARAGGPASP